MDILSSIQNKATTDTKLTEKEKGFISGTTIPVFKYLVDPMMLGVSDSLVYQLTDYIGYDILLQYIQEMVQQARALMATGNYDQAVIDSINNNLNEATRQIASFQVQVQAEYENRRFARRDAWRRAARSRQPRRGPQCRLRRASP